MSGHRKHQQRARKKKPLSHGWIVVPSKSYRDRVYFYNIISKCSSWVNPCEVFDDETSSKSSDNSVGSTNHRSSTAYLAKKKTSGGRLPPFVKENYEIEDYDEYFDKGSRSEFNSSQSTTDSPLSSFSYKTHESDSDSSKNRMSFENDKKELWLHLTSNPKKNNNLKKSLALSDFELPSTSSRVENGKQLPRGGLHSEDSKERNKNDKDNRKKKKKRSRKNKGGIFKKEDSRSCDKSVQNIALMMKDKTPAQTRILKFRRDYSEKIKNLLDISAPFKNKLDKNKNCNLDCSYGTDESLDRVDYSDRTRQGAEVNTTFQQVSSNDSSEEMDWEPSSEESDVRNINEFRQKMDRDQGCSNAFWELNGYQKITLPSQTEQLVLVLDTNIFVSCLNFVKDLRDTKIGDLSYPVIYVPWRVLQELDRLKDSQIKGANKKLSSNVRKAICFLNENFKFKHPRVYGQSFEDFNSMMDFNNFAPDDEILQTCIQLKKRHSDIQLVLLTNDKNLESKANVSGVKVFSKDVFEKTFMNSSLSPTQCNTSKVTAALQPVLQIDNYVCEIKALLKEFLSIVVETEMRIAFDVDWIRVIHKKPPWTTKEALTCFIKHWRSVFGFIFSKITLSEVENLNEKLFVKEPVNMEDVNEIISVFQRFVKFIYLSQKKKRPYLDLCSGLITKLSSLLKETPLNDASQSDSRMSQAQSPLKLTPSESLTQVQPNVEDITHHDISKVKNLFRDIWESLRCFCCSMSDVVNSPSPGSNTPLPELRLKLVQILNETGELISSLEKIFEVNLPEINEHHPLIIHFTHFLSNLYPAINLDLQNKLPKCLAAFFTDYEGRSLLSRSLIDFREFSQELIKTSEYFKAHFP